MENFQVVRTKLAMLKGQRRRSFNHAVVGLIVLTIATSCENGIPEPSTLGDLGAQDSPAFDDSRVRPDDAVPSAPVPFDTEEEPETLGPASVCPEPRIDA